MRKTFKKILTAALVATIVTGGIGSVPQNYSVEAAETSGFTIENGVLKKYTGNSSAVVIPNTVTTIGNGAFWGKKIKSVQIPSSVTAIEDSAFEDCIELTSVSIPNSVTSMGTYVFDGCTKLSSVTLPSGITEIRNNSFRNCTSLKSISIPTGVTSIGYRAFENCSSLTKLTIPANVATIESDSFNGCYSIEEISVAIGNTVYDSRNNCNAIIETASNTLIAGCKNTTIPNDIVKIGSKAFRNYSSLTSITIPEGVEDIHDSAFEGTGLSSLYIPASVKWLYTSIVVNCSNLTTIKVSEHNMTFDSRDNCNAIILTYNNELVAGCKNTTIPNTVRALETGAFSSCKELKEIVIPEGVEEIGLGTFQYCENLKTITLPTSLKKIGLSAFEYCSSLTDVVIPEGVEEIKGSVFWRCEGLKSLEIPSTVTSIGTQLLYGCQNIERIKVSSSNTVYDSRNNCNAIVETASNTLLYGCKNSTIPSGIEKIAESAFYDCDGLLNIKIPDTVTEIGEFAFANCDNLKSIEIPASVTTMGKYAISSYCKTVIVGSAGSRAQSFAKENSIPFVLIGKYDPNRDYKLDSTGATVIASVPGDADCNNKVDLNDAKLVLKIALGINAYATTQGKSNADYDRNGKVDLNDAKVVLKKALGII